MYFFQRCDIGDASRGSLSSYAHILMVLYFLQQRNPPVIPVLQEVRLHKKKRGYEVLLRKFIYEKSVHLGSEG